MECVSGIPTKGLCQSVTPASDSCSEKTEATEKIRREKMCSLMAFIYR
jgi:hypothetical protein